MSNNNNLKTLVEKCPVSLGLFNQQGCYDVMTAFNIANHLHMHGFFVEAAVFYQEAINYRRLDPDGHPSEAILLQVKLLCLIKASHKTSRKDFARLYELSEELFNYISAVKFYYDKRLNAVDTLAQINCTYELFHTGEEIDAIYLRLIYQAMLSADLPERQSQRTIPKNMYFYWDKNIPKDVEENIQYHKQFSKFNVEFFDKEKAVEWLHDVYGREAKTLFLKARHPAEEADILRVHVIDLYGGFWVDADLKIVSEELFYKTIPWHYDHVFMMTDGFFVHNDFFGSVANSAILKDCLLSLYSNCYKYEGLFISYKTGPGVFMRAINRSIHRYLQGKQGDFPSMKLLDHAFFERVSEQYPVQYKQNGSWSMV
ncbi:hypothetical protein COMNV_01667 [Commensalibacter sp. Nvir]|uniref:capsular polysaccharide synthesis protein n=1 Tax=Commensalibacter sp. Nvir TaxID=3069817 RepID=UPI002D314F2B|nr:hypothetical protein COMNV_01667 [Commensalibacter sp. Nvir]